MKKIELKENRKKIRTDREQKRDQTGERFELYRFLEERYGYSRKEMFTESEEG